LAHKQNRIRRRDGLLELREELALLLLQLQITHGLRSEVGVVAGSDVRRGVLCLEAPGSRANGPEHVKSVRPEFGLDLVWRAHTDNNAAGGLGDLLLLARNLVQPQPLVQDGGVRAEVSEDAHHARHSEDQRTRAVRFEHCVAGQGRDAGGES